MVHHGFRTRITSLKHIKLPTSIVGMREKVVLTASVVQQDLLQRYSSFSKFKRIIAYYLRVKGNLLGQRRFAPLTSEKLDKTKLAISRMVQSESFPRELRDL